MQPIQCLSIVFTLFKQMQVQGWAQARIRPTCHHHAQSTYTAVVSEGYNEDKTLLPIQPAAGLLGEELKAAKLLPESADAGAAFALLLLSIFDQSHGQCPGPTTRDSLTHRLCTTNRLALPSPRYLAVPCLGLPRGLGGARQAQMACLGLPRVLGEISEKIPDRVFSDSRKYFCT